MASLDANKTMRWTLYVSGAVLIFMGFWTLWHPVAALLSLAALFGIGLIFTGVNHLVPYFSLRGTPMCPKWLLLQGIVDVILGVFLLAKLGVTAIMIPLMVAFWICFTGFLRISISFRLRAQGFEKWWWMLVSGFLLVFCASIMAASPLVGEFYVVWMMGAALMASGLLVCIEAKTVFPPVGASSAG